MKEILLSKDMVALVDDDDYGWLDKNTWFAVVATHGNVYAARHTPTGRLKMHTAILEPPLGLIVDHKDGNGLNNQRDNLRLATNAQNSRNRLGRRDGSSVYKGVNRDYRRTKLSWAARINLNYKSLYLGTFNTEIAAALAYDAKARELFGEFARTNFSLEATAILQRIGYD